MRTSKKPKPVKIEKENLGAIRTIRFEIHSVAGDWKETIARWRELSEDVQQASNFLWQLWETAHLSADTRSKLLDVMDKLKAWHAKDPQQRGKKPKLKWPNPIPDSLDDGNRLYHELAKRFQNINRHVIALIVHKFQKTVREMKSATGNLSGWISILLNRQGRPCYIHPLPIPFSNQESAGRYPDGTSCVIIPPEKDGGNFSLKLRLWRNNIGPKGSGEITVDHIILRCQGRKVRSQLEILKRIASGEYRFKGSSIVEQNNKWFALISYQMPTGAQMAGLDTGRTAVIRPSLTRPFRMFLSPNGELPVWTVPGRSGRFIANLRTQYLMQRWSRQEAYKHSAGSTDKSHGRQSWMKVVYKLSLVWKNFVRRTNHVMAREAVYQCARFGVGRLVYCAPSESRKQSCFLSTCGKLPGRNDWTGWDWYQFQAFLGQKCQEIGIHFEIRNARQNRSRPDSVTKAS